MTQVTQGLATSTPISAASFMHSRFCGGAGNKQCKSGNAARSRADLSELERCGECSRRGQGEEHAACATAAVGPTLSIGILTHLRRRGEEHGAAVDAALQLRLHQERAQLLAAGVVCRATDRDRFDTQQAAAQQKRACCRRSAAAAAAMQQNMRQSLSHSLDVLPAFRLRG